MTESSSSELTLLDYEPDLETFHEDVVNGLNAAPRHLPCKYFYDERGSKLFDEICDLDEYYLTRAELSIMEESAAAMADEIGPGAMLVEYGSGSSIKTRLLLDHLSDLAAYVPVDISRDHLHESARTLSQAYPDVEVLPVCADFTEEFSLPFPKKDPHSHTVYFPGSTIGNFPTDAAKSVLSRITPLCGTGGGLLIGIDLQKDATTLEAAYNDSQGVTAQFNLNLLNRINRELDGDIEVEQFEHQATYNEQEGRVELYLVSQSEQEFTVGGEPFSVAEGETICTEFSHKYTVCGFEKLGADVGLTLRRQWTDREDRFAVLHFVVQD